MTRGRRTWAVAGAALVASACLPALLSDLHLYLATSAIITALLLRSIGVITGQAGMVTLCQNAFAAVGAYVVATLTFNTGMSFYIQLVLATLAGVVSGLVIALPALRARGVSLAVVTLAFGVSVTVVLDRLDFPGAAEGAGVYPPAPLDSLGGYYFFCLGLFVGCVAVLEVVSARRLGAAWLAVSVSERATAALGLSVTRTKLLGICIGSGLAGLSGALTAGQVAFLTPSTFSPLTSLSIFAVAVIFATQYVEGAVLGGIVSVVFPEVVHSLGIPADVVDLLFAVAVVDMLRRGTGGVAQQLRSKALAREAGQRPPRLQPVPAPAAPARTTSRADATPPSGPVLDARGLTVRYDGVVAVDRLDLAVWPEQIVALIGPNGAGKSSVIDALTGFVRAEGDVRLDGRSLAALRPHQRARAGLRRAFQQDRTIPQLRIAQYLDLAAGRRLKQAERARALDFVGGPDERELIAHLDVGTRRLVEVAGVLAATPRVALLDEPAAGLSPEASDLLARRIRDVPSTFGTSVLIVEHDMAHVKSVADAVTVLDFGKVIARGTPGEVFSDPIVIAAYLGEEVATA